MSEKAQCYGGPWDGAMMPAPSELFVHIGLYVPQNACFPEERVPGDRLAFYRAGTRDGKPAWLWDANERGAKW